MYAATIRTEGSQLLATCRVVRNGAVILQSNSPEEVDAILQPGDIIRHPNGQEIRCLTVPREIATNIIESQQETSFTGTPHTIDEPSVEPFTGTPHRIDLEEMD